MLRENGKISSMSFQEVKQTIAQFSPAQMEEIARWLEELRADQWDKQIEADANAGRFDALIEQAKAEAAAGHTKPL